MISVKLTISLKPDNSGTLKPVTAYVVGLGAAQQTIPAPANGANQITAQFDNVVPGDYSAFCRNIDKDGLQVSNVVVAAVHVDQPATVQIADSITSQVIFS